MEWNQSRARILPFKERVAFLDIPIDCRGDTSPLFVCIPADDDLPGGFCHHVLETLEVALGNNACVRVGRKGAIDVELHGCLLDRLYKIILSRAWNKDIIWSHANLRKGGVSVGEYCGASGGRLLWWCIRAYLASVQGLTPKDTLCGDLEVRRFGIDDHGRLPAELERNGREVLSRRLRYDAGDNSISRVSD
jgi:hypothetical protein